MTVAKELVSTPRLTWEQAVQWLREQPDKQELVRACFFDDPLAKAAERFWSSEEWQAVRELVPPVPGGMALDLGAGRGISSYAMARDGWNVTALEPDPSALVGAAAVRELAEESGLDIRVVSDYSERLPFDDCCFDFVNCRQALHHARDIGRTCREIFRVLKPGGRLLATREHVISRRSDLPRFLEGHPLHHLYGGENAYLVSEYEQSIAQAGLRLVRTLAPLDSPVNFFPMSREQWLEYVSRPIGRYFGNSIAAHLCRRQGWFARWLLGISASLLNGRDNTPGRLYSFLAIRPA